MSDNKKSRVVVIPCDDYDEKKVYERLKCGLDELGGIGRFIKPEEKVLVKLNLLSAAQPERAVTTHPSVAKAVLRLLNEAGCADVKYGDSPGYGTCESALRMLGIDEECFGARMTPMSDAEHVDFPEGMTCKEFDFCKEIVESDAIINVCKMKTHALERITGAVKNVYGFICGYRKAAGHVKFPNDTVFARMLADIHRCTKPRLHIMDGIMAMEGNGPGSGTPTPMNVLIVSDDPVAVDTVFCYLVNLDPEIIPTNSQGMRMGIGTDKEEEIEIVLCGEKIADNSEVDPAEEKTHADNSDVGCVGTYGTCIISKDELFEKYGNANFDVPRGKPRGTFLMRYSGFMTKLARRPMIDKNKCVKCGICVNHCPVPGKAVDFKNGKDKPPVYDYKKCIRCYCCQEMCPKHAISARRGLFGRKD